MRFKLGLVQVRITEYDIIQRVDRPAVGTGWNTAINKPVMVDILIRQIQYGCRAQLELGSWVDTDPVTLVKVSVIVQTFIKRIDPESRCLTGGDVAVDLQIKLVFSVPASLITVERLANHTLFCNPV